MTFSTLNKFATAALITATTLLAGSFSASETSTASEQTSLYRGTERLEQQGTVAYRATGRLNNNLAYRATGRLDNTVAYRAAGRVNTAAIYRGSEHGLG